MNILNLKSKYSKNVGVNKLTKQAKRRKNGYDVLSMRTDI